ncbi:hypothetical protein COTS27_00187 [Spirochaetota bacterium]|nr:hypothetical protein COTS27_00187 [Spirochaetota bacterium]
MVGYFELVMDEHTLIIVQARLASKRLPKKSIKIAKSYPLIVHLLDRLILAKLPLVLAVPKSDKIIFSELIAKYYHTYYHHHHTHNTTHNNNNNNNNNKDDTQTKLADTEKSLRNRLYLLTGSSDHENDVLTRFTEVLTEFSSLSGAVIKRIVRVTGDNPFISLYCLLTLIRTHIEMKSELSYHSGLPYGAGVEIVSIPALMQAADKATAPYDREHVTPYLHSRPEQFKKIVVPAPEGYVSPHLRVSVDTEADFRNFERRLDRYQSIKKSQSCTPPLRTVIPLRKIIEAERKKTQ